MTYQIVDWEKCKFERGPGGTLVIPKKTAEKIRGAFQHFFAERTSLENSVGAKRRAAATEAIQVLSQHFGTNSDFPTSVLDNFAKVHAQDNVDEAWAECFGVRTLTDRNSIEVRNVENGLTFEAVAEGAKAKVYKMGGTKTTVSADMYGGGLGWSRILLDDRDYWTIEDNTIAFTNKWASAKQDIFYALIEALDGVATAVSWQAVVPTNLPNTDANYDAIRDMETISEGAFQIINKVKGKGYGVNINTPMTLIAPLQDRNRVLRALGVLNANISGNMPGVRYNINPRFTQELSATTKWYMTPTGGGSPMRNIRLERMPLTLFGRFEEESYSDVVYGWGRYGGSVVDSELWAVLATS